MSYEYTQLGNSKKISCHQKKWNSSIIKIDWYEAKLLVSVDGGAYMMWEPDEMIQEVIFRPVFLRGWSNVGTERFQSLHPWRLCFEQGIWARWSPEMPANLSHSMVL